MKTLNKYDLDFVFKCFDNEKKIQFGKFDIKTGSSRIRLFRKNKKCVCCGLEGNIFLLQQNKDELPHLNMFNKETNILFTKDHIIAKSKGGKNHISNYQTMCFECNLLKADMDITLEQLKLLKGIKK